MVPYLSGSTGSMMAGSAEGGQINPYESLKWMVIQIEQERGMRWKGPTPDMLNGDPLFDAIWGVIKTWDVNVPEEYQRYCGSTGNHARAIYDAVMKVKTDE